MTPRPYVCLPQALHAHMRTLGCGEHVRDRDRDEGLAGAADPTLVCELRCDGAEAEALGSQRPGAGHCLGLSGVAL